jgi:hypothetical protein
MKSDLCSRYMYPNICNRTKNELDVRISKKQTLTQFLSKIEVDSATLHLGKYQFHVRPRDQYRCENCL